MSQQRRRDELRDFWWLAASARRPVKAVVEDAEIARASELFSHLYWKNKRWTGSLAHTDKFAAGAGLVYAFPHRAIMSISKRAWVVHTLFPTKGTYFG